MMDGVKRIMVLSLVVILTASQGLAQDPCDSFGHELFSWVLRREPCCQKCGCKDNCGKICKLVEEEREVSTTCWGYVEEDFCLPGPGHVGCQHCEEVCNDCEANAKEKVHAKPKGLFWYDWLPSCSAEIKTRKKLMKHVETKKVVGYKWVVEDLCKSCREKEKPVELPADVTAPAPPKKAGLQVIEPIVTR